MKCDICGADLFDVNAPDGLRSAGYAVAEKNYWACTDERCKHALMAMEAMDMCDAEWVTVVSDDGTVSKVFPKPIRGANSEEG